MKFMFAIPGEPQGKGRHRAFLDKKREGLVYKTPDKTANYEQRTTLNYIGAGGPKFAGPLRVAIIAYFRIPKKVSKVNRISMVSGKIRPTKTPDIDNISKIIYDSLNKAAWRDDSCIVESHAEKYYGEWPRVEVYVSTLDDALEPQPAPARTEPLPGQMILDI